MAGVTFPNGDPRKRLAKIANAIETGTRNAVYEAALATEALAKQRLTDLDAIDQGIARASVASRVDKIGGPNTRYVGTTYVGAAHGIWIEAGRRGIVSSPTKDPYAAKAAFPSVVAIQGWVRRQFRKLAPSGRTASGRARKPADQDVKRVAFAVALKIYRFGIKPRPFLGPSFRRVARGFQARVVYHVRSALANI